MQYTGFQVKIFHRVKDSYKSTKEEWGTIIPWKNSRPNPERCDRIDMAIQNHNSQTPAA
jgi:hypothetical protein